MNLIFFGTSSFAAEILQSLISSASIRIVAVITKEDVPQGRSLKLSPPPVKKFLLESGSSIPIYQPRKASSEEFAEVLKNLDADLFLVVAYGEILSANILSIPPKGCYNIHASLLPKYRGAAPIQRALMDGCRETGVSIIEMVQKMDAGDILTSKSVTVAEEMNFDELRRSLLEQAKLLTIEVLARLDFYKENKVKQDEAQASFAQKIEASDLLICWDEDVEKVHNRIRALSPQPGAYCIIQYGADCKRLKILQSRVVNQILGEPGLIASKKNTLFIACRNGSLEVLVLQLEGKKAMTAASFLCGAPLNLKIVM